MSTDTKAVIGTIVGTGLVVAGLLSAQLSRGNASLNTRINDLDASLNTRIDDLRDDVRGMDARLRAVEVALGKVDQRLLTIERVVLPGPDADE